MTNYINIDDIRDKRLQSYARKVDTAKPDANDPNSVGDYNDGKLSEREIKKVEQMITEYFTANPEKDSLGIQKPVGASVAEQMTNLFGSKLKYAKYQLDQTFKSIGKKISQLV